MSDVWAWLTDKSVPPLVFFLWAVLFGFAEYRVYKKRDAFWEKECSKCL